MVLLFNSHRKYHKSVAMTFSYPTVKWLLLFNSQRQNGYEKIIVANDELDDKKTNFYNSLNYCFF